MYFTDDSWLSVTARQIVRKFSWLGELYHLLLTAVLESLQQGVKNVDTPRIYQVLSLVGVHVNDVIYDLFVWPDSDNPPGCP